MVSSNLDCTITFALRFYQQKDKDIANKGQRVNMLKKVRSAYAAKMLVISHVQFYVVNPSLCGCFLLQLCIGTLQ